MTLLTIVKKLIDTYCNSPDSEVSLYYLLQSRLYRFIAVYFDPPRHKPPQVSPLTNRVSHRAWIESGEWLSTTELQSKRSNPNARRQLGDLMEDAPSPPNHGGDEFLSCPRQAAIRGQAWASALAVVPQGAHTYAERQEVQE